MRPIGPPRPTVVVVGCDPALPLLETPLAAARPAAGVRLRGRAAAPRPCAWPRPSLVHAVSVHRVGPGEGDDSARASPGGAEVVGFASWREGLVVRPGAGVRGLDDVARQGLRLVNREPGAQARTLLDRERLRLGLEPPS